MKTQSFVRILASLLTLFAVPAMATVVPITSDQSNYTFANGTTYYVSNNVTLSGTTTFEGGAILKYNSRGQLNIAGTLVSPLGVYPAIFTSYNDNTVGETVTGSSGTPAGGDVTTFLDVTNVTLSRMRFSYASYPFEYMANVSFQNCEFFNDQYMFVKGFQIANNLFVTVPNLDWFPTASYSLMQNNTFVGCPWIILESPLNDELVVTSDNLFDSSTAADWTFYGTIGEANAFYNCNDYLGGNAGLPTDITLPSEPAYQTGPLGHYYLPSNSSLIDDGIMTAAAAEMDSLTTQTAETPDSGYVDIGYHYPISTNNYVELNSDKTDYTFKANTTYFIDASITLYGTSTFESGTVLKFNGSGQINIDSGGTVVCPPSGYPAYPAIFTSYNDDTVGHTISGSSGTPADGDVGAFLNYSGTLSGMRFSYASSPFAQTAISFQNCEFFYDDYIGVETTEIFNNLFVGVFEFDWYPVPDSNGNGFLQNNTFVNCDMVILDSDPNYFFSLRQVGVADNLFDTSYVYDWTASPYFDFSSTGEYNAFYNCDDWSSGSSTDFGTIEPAYQTGPLGNYYLGNSPLVDAGDVPAANLGLESLTTQTNQVTDSGYVDIGYHYEVGYSGPNINTNIVVTAYLLWADSGIPVIQGQTLYISATGIWNGFQGNVDGNGLVDPTDDLFLAGVNHDSLIAYVGTNRPSEDSMGNNRWGDSSYFPRSPGRPGTGVPTQGYWLAGTNAEITVDRSGELWFLINDDAVSKDTNDNSGYLNVSVRLR